MTDHTVRLSRRELERLAFGNKVKARTDDGETVWIRPPRGGLSDYAR